MKLSESLKKAVIKNIVLNDDYDSYENEICIRAIELEDGRVIVLSGSYQIDVDGVWGTIENEE